MKKSFVEKNKQKYDVEDNTSVLSFENGSMISKGTLNSITINIDLRYCKGCGICTEECPTGSLQLKQERGKLHNAIHESYTAPTENGRTFHPNKPLTWQELPYHGALVLTNDTDSYNLTGAWRVGEVVVGDANTCVLCGLCYQHCPEDIIFIESKGEN